MFLEGGPGPYLGTLKAMQTQLSVSTIVPGHGPMGEGKAALEHFLAYLHSLQEQVAAAFASGWSLEETLERVAVPALLSLPTTMPVTPESQALLVHLHRLNVLATYRELEKVSPQEA